MSSHFHYKSYRKGRAISSLEQKQEYSGQTKQHLHTQAGMIMKSYDDIKTFPNVPVKMEVNQQQRKKKDWNAFFNKKWHRLYYSHHILQTPENWDGDENVGRPLQTFFFLII